MTDLLKGFGIYENYRRSMDKSHLIRVKGMATTATRSTRTQKTATTTRQPQTGNQAQATMSAAPTREQIAARAFEIYMRSGCRPGQDEHNWLQAEKELLQEGRKVAL
jgi:hypothetical protein